MPDIGAEPEKTIEASFVKNYELKRIDIDEDEKAFIATITTSAIDRDNEVVLPKGGNYEDFLKNPVILFGHNYNAMPVARALWVKAQGGRIVAKGVPAPTQIGSEVYELIKGGFLNAVSIGFKPIDDEFGPPTTKELEKHPDWSGVKTVYRKWKLLEFSVVPVPSNPDALIEAVGKGLAVPDQIKEQLEKHKSKKTQPRIISIPKTVKIVKFKHVRCLGKVITTNQIREQIKNQVALKLGRAI